jgi:type II secretory pathway pseudopilin PulG
MNTHANRSKDDEVGLALASYFVALQRRRKKPAQGERGMTLVEVAVAGALLALGLTSLCVLLGTTVNEVKRGHTASGAQQNTVARLDQMRNLTWASITNAATVATVLGTPTSSDSSSTISREVITVSPAAVPQSLPLPIPAPLPPPPPGPGFSVIKTGGSVNIIPSPFPILVAEKLVNVTVTTEWRTAGASHQRQLSSLFSQWGSTAPKPVPSATPSPTP